MGGPGSGNCWRPGHRKRCVEECDAIDAAHLGRIGWLEPGTSRTGSLSWPRGAAATSVISCTADLTDPAASKIRVSHTVLGESVSYPIRLVTTRPHYGGVRWWFVCPLVADGRSESTRLNSSHG